MPLSGVLDERPGLRIGHPRAQQRPAEPAPHAQGRPPTERELAQSTAEFHRIFNLAQPVHIVDKVWEGTSHILGPFNEHVGYVVTMPGSTDDTRIERMVTWGYTPPTFPNDRHAFKLLYNGPSWGTVVDEVEHHAPLWYTQMTVTYRELSQQNVSEIAGNFLPGAGFQELYTVGQGGWSVCPPNCVLLWMQPVDGWLLRVLVDPAENRWQDHWTFKSSFQIEELPGVLPRVEVVPHQNQGIVGYDANDYYQWAKNAGAVSWAFVDYTVEEVGPQGLP